MVAGRMRLVKRRWAPRGRFAIPRAVVAVPDTRRGGAGGTFGKKVISVLNRQAEKKVNTVHGYKDLGMIVGTADPANNAHVQLQNMQPQITVGARVDQRIGNQVKLLWARFDIALRFVNAPPVQFTGVARIIITTGKNVVNGDNLCPPDLAGNIFVTAARPLRKYGDFTVIYDRVISLNGLGENTTAYIKKFVKRSTLLEWRDSVSDIFPERVYQLFCFAVNNGAVVSTDTIRAEWTATYRYIDV